MLVDAAFGPDALKVITQAFDEAWASIADQYTSTEQVEAARIQLANDAFCSQRWSTRRRW
jgi:hypothetical protein